MSLLDELKSLDISDIVNARASISSAVQSQQLQEVLSGGAAQAALAGLGSTIGNLREGFDSPAALLEPLLNGVTGVADFLDIDIELLDRYGGAIREGLEIVVKLFEGLEGDAADFGKGLGLSLGGALEGASDVLSSYNIVGEDLGRFRGLLNRVEKGVPADPQDFAALAIEILLPFPAANLQSLRSGINNILEGSVAISFPDSRTSGLLLALEAVTTAAVSGNVAALEKALNELQRVRNATVISLQEDLRRIGAQVERFDLQALFQPLADASTALQSAEQGVLEFMEEWRQRIADGRQQIEDIDLDQVRAMLTEILQFLEQQAQERIANPIDIQVQQLKEGLRDLLSHLPLRDLRAELSRFIHKIAQSIQDADLDQYARAVREVLEGIRTPLESGDLAAEIQAALQVAEEAINNALGDIITALEDIGTSINNLAGQAQDILDRTAAALNEFQTALNEISQSIDGLNVEKAAEEVINELKSLRETAESLLKEAPLPDSLRPLIEQLVDSLQGIDFDEVFQPLHAAAAEFDIPDEISDTITEVLEEAGARLQNLIPAELIAEIEAEVSNALDVIRDFDPGALLSGVSSFLAEAADFIEDLDPRPVAAEIRGPFQALLDVIDSAHPRRLLAPVIEAYDSLLGNIPLPSPETAAQSTAETVGNVGENIAQSAASPIQQLSPSGTVEISESVADAPVAEPSTETVRPGDVVRLFGYLPNKLRETLAGLQAGPAGEALRSIDGLCAGLAKDMRELQAAIAEIEERIQDGFESLLSPLAEAQLRAQAAIEANISAEGFEMEASLSLVANAGPGPLRLALTESLRGTCQQVRSVAATLGGMAGASLENAATALEGCRLAGLGEDLDALLEALDPEPIANELDELMAAILAKAPDMLNDLESDLQTAINNLKSIIREYNPGAQLQKFLTVFEVLREELDVLDPRRLADELGEIHAAIRETIAAYDPAIFAEELAQIITAIADNIRSLDPAALLGDLTFLDEIATRVENALPINALAGVGESLGEVGEELAKIDPSGLLESVEELAPRLVNAFELAAEGIRNEIVALLESLRFASASASVSAGGG